MVGLEGQGHTEWGRQRWGPLLIAALGLVAASAGARAEPLPYPAASLPSNHLEQHLEANAHRQGRVLHDSL